MARPWPAPMAAVNREAHPRHSDPSQLREVSALLASPASAGDLAAGFERCALAYHRSGPDLPYHLAVYPDVEVAVQDHCDGGSLLRLAVQELPAGTVRMAGES